MYLLILEDVQVDKTRTGGAVFIIYQFNTDYDGYFRVGDYTCDSKKDPAFLHMYSTRNIYRPASKFRRGLYSTPRERQRLWLRKIRWVLFICKRKAGCYQRYSLSRQSFFRS